MTLLPWHSPYDWRWMFRFLGARAVQGVETFTDGRYIRSFALKGHAGLITVVPDDAAQGMGGDSEKGIALPILPWWNAVAINDVPAQTDFYSAANGRLLNDLLRSARDSEKVALLLKVWRQRLSYRLVRSAEESKIALSAQPSVTTGLPFISEDLATAISQQGLEAALSQPLARIMEQVQLALDNGNDKPDVIYLTGGSARSPLIKQALAAHLPGIPVAGGDDFGSVTAGLARWAQVVFGE